MILTNLLGRRVAIKSKPTDFPDEGVIVAVYLNAGEVNLLVELRDQLWTIPAGSDTIRTIKPA